MWTSRIALALALLAPLANAADLAEIAKHFQDPPADSRIMMRWWWFGPAVTKAQLDREMRLMKEGGIGGFEVQPVYPIVLDDQPRGVRNHPFLSDEFIEALRFTAGKAQEYGLRMDVTLGSGWPYGGPQIPITQAAGRLRVYRVKPAPGLRRIPVPSVGNGEQFLAAFQDGRELTDIRDGALWVTDAAASGGEILFFVSSRTGMMVKRPSVGAEGFVFDHYDRSALETYLGTVGDRIMQAFGPVKPHAIFCDSLEVFGSDWTPAMLEEFRNRRGYDLRPHLPALVTDRGPETAGVRHDWGRTLTELLEERFLAPMQQWVKSKGASLRIQNYGIPPATLSSSAYADLPEGEGSQWKVVRASRWAASASHLYGRPVTSSETWTWLHSPSFRATPLDMKAEADLHFLQGITQLIGHGWPYTPDGEEYPGARFYAAAVFNEKNPWWIVMPDVTRYLQRMSYVLRQGRAANDVALYLPNADAWSHFTAGQVHMIEALRERVGPVVMPQILESGYGLDFIDDGTLAKLGRIEKDTLVFGQNRYRIVVLPGVEYMPLQTMRTLEAFAKAGGIVVATRRAPSAVPGLQASAAEQSEMREVAGRLFGSGGAARVVSKDEDLGSALRAKLTPDMALSQPVPDIGFVHRSTDQGEIYFVANTGNKPVSVDAAFRVAGREAEGWDAMSGQVFSAPAQRSATTTTVRLELAPYESQVVVFPVQSRKLRPRPEGTPGPPVEISQGWKVIYAGSIPVQRMDELRSWTETQATRFYSGQATYEKDIEVPGAWLRDGGRVLLDFGDGTPLPAVIDRRNPGTRAWLDAPLREAAVVSVNGTRAGSVWSAPFQIDITSQLRPGKNQLRIVVANTAINHMAGRSLPDYRLLNLRYGVRFEPQDMNRLEPVPSGIVGKVRLVPLAGSRADSQSASRTAARVSPDRLRGSVQQGSKTLKKGQL
jgi:hypothetical protein